MSYGWANEHNRIKNKLEDHFLVNKIKKIIIIFARKE